MTGHQDPVPRQVIAWGRSVLASALVAGLAQRTGLEVVQIDATLPAVLGALHRRQAHAVVCDLASVPAECILALLAAHPQLVVVIVDPDADRAMVLTCRRPPMRTIDDLVAALLDGARGGEDLVPGPVALPYDRGAARICVSERGVTFHIGEILARLHVHDRDEAIANARRLDPIL